MANEQFLEDSLNTLASAYAIDDIATAIHKMRDAYGFANITYRSLRRTEAGKVSSKTVISTSDPEWFKQYETQDLISIDPIVKSAWQAPLPLDWDLVDRRSKSARHYFQEMKRFNIGDRGLTIPISPANRPPGLFSFISDGMSDQDWKALRRRSEADMMLFGQHIHFHVLRLEQTGQIGGVLTERGRECLELVLNGHKPTLIGKFLGLSVHTVRMHLRHAQERLDCHSLPEAVGKALELGIINKAARVILFGFVTQVLQGNPLSDVWSAMIAG